ncbi:FAD-binding oxidoreductase [Brevibacterium sp. JSBI002]|uniref:FAD-binding oxidoreductase n=1 Tax=Brevibacterium sp. JSBI002 TaxID=2886045 RepID=UPI00222FC48F|nr:FAD-binding oxidoreductase [Brevibacterium sp. JSBI002]UZD61196.1 FAD-binding oxidoreductase [Brevibacterium sp. JSBI002]
MSLTTDELPRLASPSSTAELSELMARAHAEHRTVAVFGGGTAFDDHPPVSTPGLLIDLTSIAEVADHSSDTIRAGAGARTSALNRTAAQSGREILADLPLDRIEAGATLGGMIATAATGPRRLRRPRLAETVLSVTTVAADGTIARTAHGLHPNLGGRDLPGLVTGSWGSRAIIVEAEICLNERPEAQRFVWIPGSEAAADLLVARRVPDAVVIERPPGSPAATVIFVEGEADEVEAEVGHLVDRIPGATPCGEPEWWGRRARLAATIGVSVAPSFIPTLIDAVARLETTIGYPLQLRGSATGTFELGIGAPESEPGVATRVVLEHLRSFGLHFIAARLIHAPAPVWDEVDAWGPQPGRAGVRDIKKLVDPRGILAPGRGIAGI